jgi:hypothetical protein
MTSPQRTAVAVVSDPERHRHALDAAGLPTPDERPRTVAMHRLQRHGQNVAGFFGDDSHGGRHFRPQRQTGARAESNNRDVVHDVVANLGLRIDLADLTREAFGTVGVNRECDALADTDPSDVGFIDVRPHLQTIEIQQRDERRCREAGGDGLALLSRD